VKERFSRWCNKRHERKETLWMDRYKSVSVEGRRERRGDAGASRVDVLRMMACCIDLNPVRAEWVQAQIDGLPVTSLLVGEMPKHKKLQGLGSSECVKVPN